MNRLTKRDKNGKITSDAFTNELLERLAEYEDAEESGLLEEIQQYRAIGTVEGYERAIQSSIDNYNLYREYKEKVQEYEAIGTVEEFKALKEKSVAKKPTPIDYEKYIDVVKNAKFLRGAYWCPNCKHTVMSGAYCNHCGQKLDWQ